MEWIILSFFWFGSFAIVDCFLDLSEAPHSFSELFGHSFPKKYLVTLLLFELLILQHILHYFDRISNGILEQVYRNFSDLYWFCLVIELAYYSWYFFKGGVLLCLWEAHHVVDDIDQDWPCVLLELIFDCFIEVWSFCCLFHHIVVLIEVKIFLLFD